MLELVKSILENATLLINNEHETVNSHRPCPVLCHTL